MSDLIPVSRMIVHKACMVVAINKLKEIQGDNEIAASMLLELELAANLAEAFNRTWSSIYWNKARKRTRERVTITLRDLAVKIIDHIEETMVLFDQLCDEQEANPTIKLTNKWIAFQVQLGGIRRDLNYHGAFIERNSIEALPLMKLIEDSRS